MKDLINYITEHADRNACRCGKCVVSGEDKSLPGHTVDMYFFDVCAKGNPDAQTLKSLCNEAQLNLFDKVEHNYIDIGGQIGDQGLALMLMGLGELVGLWKVFQPKMFPFVDEALGKQMAGMGFITIKSND